jgi:hypothetical protein
MIQFIKPEALDGNVLEAALLEAGITLPPRSISVSGDALFLEVTEAQRATVEQVIESIYG